MASLSAQRESFRKRMAAQPVLQRATPVAKPSDTPVSGTSGSNDAVGSANRLKRGRNTTLAMAGSNADETRMRFYRIMSHIKKQDGPLTAAELKRDTNVDIMKDAALLKALAQNSKIIYDADKGTFAYKPDYNVRTKEEVLALLRERGSRGGIEICELKDSNANVAKLAEELSAAGEILIARNRDGTARILYYNDTSLNTEMDEEFQVMWRSLKVPDEADLPKRMAEAGLKTMEVFETGVKKEPKTKRPKQRTRKGKITNTHLEGIDLTKDYIPTK
ncbi:hypothetical protein BDF22DRAFT_676314 [Syncephalis plumigaleata]|nr:hypothetical protein BDF22DRAFT_676314 [Syncephalis plumigaleata]